MQSSERMVCLAEGGSRGEHHENNRSYEPFIRMTRGLYFHSIGSNDCAA